eukprot:1152958-Pelagomonas_calceolata.AAC.2
MVTRLQILEVATPRAFFCACMGAPLVVAHQHVGSLFSAVAGVAGVPVSIVALHAHRRMPAVLCSLTSWLIPHSR